MKPELLYAATPFRAEFPQGSALVVDAGGWTLAQALEYQGRPISQHIAHACLWAAAPEMARVLRELVGAANAARQSGRTEYDGVAAYWAKHGPDAKRALDMLTPNAELT